MLLTWKDQVMFAIIEHGSDVVFEAVNSSNFGDFASAIMIMAGWGTIKRIFSSRKRRRSGH